MIYVLEFNPKIASHRLRLNAAITSLQFVDHSLGTHLCSSQIVSRSDIRSLLTAPLRLCNIPLDIIFKLLFSKKVLLASKPFTLDHCIILFFAKFLLGCRIVVDISDNQLLSLPADFQRFLFWVRQSLVFRIADRVTCPSFTLKQSLANCRQNKISIISDVLDKCSIPLSSPYSFFSRPRSKRLVWFGCGFISKGDTMIISESFRTLIDFISSLSRQDCGETDLSKVELLVSTNESDFAQRLLEPYASNFALIKCVKWSQAILKYQLGRAGSVILTYSTDSFSTTKSSNRLQTALASGLPTLVINPPQSCIDLLDEIATQNIISPVVLAHIDGADKGFASLLSLINSRVPFSSDHYLKLTNFFALRDSAIFSQWRDLFANLLR